MITGYFWVLVLWATELGLVGMVSLHFYFFGFSKVAILLKPTCKVMILTVSVLKVRTFGLLYSNLPLRG